MERKIINTLIIIVTVFSSILLMRPNYAIALIIVSNNHFIGLQPIEGAKFNLGDPITIGGTEYITIDFVGHDGTPRTFGNKLSATSDFGFSFSDENTQVISGVFGNLSMPDALPIIVSSGPFFPLAGQHTIQWTWGYGISSSPISWTTSTFTQNFSVKDVPEPSTMLLLGSGLAGLVVLGRKRRFRKA